MPALEVRALTKHYDTPGGRVTALAEVSFHLDQGRLMAVLGPSGSGKTTLLSLIAGLLRPSGGEILLDGRTVQLASSREAAAYRRSRVGLVFQDHHLVPYLDAMENLLVMPRLSGRVEAPHRERARLLLEEFGLGERARHRPAALSGGERQRVAIARALMNSPEILLVDEPTSNLDTERGQQVLRLLREQAHRHSVTCLMVTHDPRMAAQADETLMLVDGRVSATRKEGAHR